MSCTHRPEQRGRYKDVDTGWTVTGIASRYDRNLSLLKTMAILVHTISGVHQTPNGYWDNFPGVKWRCCGVDHSPKSRSEVRNGWSSTSPPTLCLQGMYGTTLSHPPIISFFADNLQFLRLPIIVVCRRNEGVDFHETDSVGHLSPARRRMRLRNYA